MQPARRNPIREDRLRHGKNPKDAAWLKDTGQVVWARREGGSNPARAAHRDRGDLESRVIPYDSTGDVAGWDPQRISARPQSIEGEKNLKKANRSASFAVSIAGTAARRGGGRISTVPGCLQFGRGQRPVGPEDPQGDSGCSPAVTAGKASGTRRRGQGGGGGPDPERSYFPS